MGTFTDVVIDEYAYYALVVEVVMGVTNDYDVHALFDGVHALLDDLYALLDAVDELLDGVDASV